MVWEPGIKSQITDNTLNSYKIYSHYSTILAQLQI
jgi:hypothetical protein